MRGKTAPLRSLICTATIAAMGFVVVLSPGFHLCSISLYKTHLPIPVEKNIPTPVPSPEPDSILPYKSLSPSPLKFRSGYEKEMADFTHEVVPHSTGLNLHPFAFIKIMGLIWLWGVIFQLLRLCYGVVLVKKFRKSLSRPRDIPFYEMVHNVADTFRIDCLPGIYSSPLIKSPVTIGIINPIVIIPEKLFNTINENELKSILIHELAHIYHYDQVAGLIKRLILAVHWWNPLVYLISRYHEQVREEVSDNYVLRELHPTVYTRSLMDLVEKVCLINNLPTTSGMAGKYFNLRKRVEQILSNKRSIAMGTKLYLKAIIFAFCLALTIGISGIHGKVKSETSVPVIVNLEETMHASKSGLINDGKSFTPHEILDQDRGNFRANSTEETATHAKNATIHVLENAAPDIITVEAVIKAENRDEKQREQEPVHPVVKSHGNKMLKAVPVSKSNTILPAPENPDPLEDANAAIKNKNYKTAFELLLPLTNEKNAEAQTILGTMYINGQGVEQDLIKGISLIMKAANQGFDPARITALNINKDFANQGDTTAMYNVGYMCFNGWGVEQDSDVCLKWLEKAGKLGHEKSSKILSNIYEKGMFGITPDEEKAIYWKNLPAVSSAGLDGEWKGSFSRKVPHSVYSPFVTALGITAPKVTGPFIHGKVMFGPGVTWWNHLDGLRPINTLPATQFTMKSTYEFKTKGDKLTGKVILLLDKIWKIKDDIKDGTIDGNNIYFTVDSKFGGLKSTFKYTGKLIGDILNLT